MAYSGFFALREPARPAAFAKVVDEAKGAVGRDGRLRKMSEADRMVVEGMPLISLVLNSIDFMRKRYVKCLPLNTIYEFRLELG